MDYNISRMIQEYRKEFLANGGAPVDFPGYLKKQGVKMAGPLMIVDEDFVLMTKLKFG